MTIPNNKITWGETFEFIGKDAMSLADLVKFYDAYVSNNRGIKPKAIVMDKLRQRFLFGEQNCDCSFKVNGKTFKVYHWRGIPLIPDLPKLK